MIPFIRSLSELMALTHSRDSKKHHRDANDLDISIVDSGQRKRYLRSLDKKEINLPDSPKSIRHRWKREKESISRFIDDLDYNNQIKSSYELTLLERQSKRNHEDVA